MRGGSLPGIITEWKRLAGQEPDGPLRSTYAGLTLVFAEAAGGLVGWQKGLEGWNVLESQVVLGWQREARQDQEVKSLRQAILRALAVRLRIQVPAEVEQAVEGTNDLTILGRWFDTALTVETVADFRAAMASS